MAVRLSEVERMGTKTLLIEEQALFIMIDRRGIVICQRKSGKPYISIVEIDRKVFPKIIEEWQRC